jgi:hypothetical protein
MKSSDDSTGDFIDLVARVMKFEVCHRARRATNGLSIHPAYKTDEGFCGWKEFQDLCALVVEICSIDLNEPDVIAPASRQSCRSQSTSSLSGALETASLTTLS